MSRLGVGFIGCGRIMDLNILGYLDRDDVEVAAFCDTSQELLTRRVSEYGDIKTYTDHMRMLQDPAVDMVEVLTPHYLHKPMVLDALAAGKHVSLQKPPAMSLEEMDEMIEAADRAGRKLKVYENFVFYPPYLLAKKMIEAGEIGEPVSIRYKMNSSMAPTGWEVPLESWAWRIVEEMCGGGPCLFDDGYHKWSVAIDLLGEVEKVFAWIGAKEVIPGIAVDSPGVVMWRYKQEKDLFGVCDASISNELHIKSRYYAIDERMEVTGEKGVIWVTKWTAEMLKVPPVILYRDGTLTEYDDIRQDWADSFIDCTHQFIDCIIEDTEPHLSGERGREVLKFALAMLKSSREGREVLLDEM
ncbi:MAG: Gfo/Idh/MocA family oxidoreductase [Actinomycetota bacterium]